MKEIFKTEKDCLVSVTLECSPSEFLTIKSALRYLAEAPVYNVGNAVRLLSETITMQEGGSHES